MDLAKGNDPRFAPASFDYVFHRLLVLGMTDWSAYIAAVGKLLRQGGWAEMQDLDITIRDVSGNSLSKDWTFFRFLEEDCQAIGLDIEIGGKLTSYMENTGMLSHISGSVYKQLLKPTPEIPEGELIGKLMEKDSGPSSQAIVRSVCGRRRSAEEVERLCADAEQRFADIKQGDHNRMFVAIGQKTN